LTSPTRINEPNCEYSEIAPIGANARRGEQEQEGEEEEKKEPGYGRKELQHAHDERRGGGGGGEGECERARARVLSVIILSSIACDSTLNFSLTARQKYTCKFGYRSGTARTGTRDILFVAYFCTSPRTFLFPPLPLLTGVIFIRDRRVVAASSSWGNAETKAVNHQSHERCANPGHDRIFSDSTEEREREREKIE